MNKLSYKREIIIQLLITKVIKTQIISVLEAKTLISAVFPRPFLRQDIHLSKTHAQA